MTDVNKDFDWTPIKYAGAFGATIAVADKLYVMAMIERPIMSSIRGMVGDSFSGDIATVIAFGVIYYVFDGYNKQYFNP